MASNELTKEEIVAAVLSLSQADFRQVLCTIAENNPYPEESTYLMNKWKRFKNKEKLPKRDCKWGEKTDTKVSLFEERGPTPRRLGRDGSASRAVESSLTASLVPDLHGLSAWKVPVLFRGDLVPKGGKLFIDVEKLSMKTDWVGNSPGCSKSLHRQVANNVAIVNEAGTLVFWAFIYRDPASICQYFTSLHRINKSKVLHGVPIEVVSNAAQCFFWLVVARFFGHAVTTFGDSIGANLLHEVRPLIEKCFEGNVVVGANLKNDFGSLSYEKELCDTTKSQDNLFKPRPSDIDIQTFFYDSAGPFSLKALVEHFFPEKSQRFQSDFHSSIADARFTMMLYLKMIDLKNEGYIHAMSFDITRPKKQPFKNDPNDKCKCNIK